MSEQTGFGKIISVSEGEPWPGKQVICKGCEYQFSCLGRYEPVSDKQLILISKEDTCSCNCYKEKGDK